MSHEGSGPFPGTKSEYLGSSPGRPVPSDPHRPAPLGLQSDAKFEGDPCRCIVIEIGVFRTRGQRIFPGVAIPTGISRGLTWLVSVFYLSGPVIRLTSHGNLTFTRLVSYPTKAG